MARRHALRASLVLLAVLSFAAPACSGSGDANRPATISRMDPAEAAAVAARAEESALRTMEVLRRSFRGQSNDFASCFDTLEIDGADLCGDDYTAHFLFDWSDCFGTSGHILIDNVRDTVPAGAQCTAPTGYSFDHASAYDFTAGIGNADHEVHVTVDANGLLASDGSPRDVASDVSVHAMGTGSGGSLIYDATVDSTWSSVWATNGTPTIVTSGNSHVHLTVLQRDYQVTATGLTFREDCCHPVAGTVLISSMVMSSSFQATATFGPACGDATVDGTPVTLAPCGP